MKQKILMAVLFAAFTVLAATPVSAKITVSGLYVVGKIGAAFPSSKDYGTGYSMDADAGFSGEIGVGYNFLTGSDIFGLDATIGYYNSSTDQQILGINGNIDTDVVPLALTAKVGGQFAERFGAYLGAGLDLVFVSTDVGSDRFSVRGYPGTYRFRGSNTDTVFGFHLLGGLTVDITDHFFLGLEGKYMWTSEAKATVSLSDQNGNELPFYSGKDNANVCTVMGLAGVRF
jgi:opacity protein-like surface antigen